MFFLIFTLIAFSVIGLIIFLLAGISARNRSISAVVAISMAIWIFSAEVCKIYISQFLKSIGFIILSIILGIYTFRMFKILSVQEETLKGKIQYFFRLKFSQLTIILNITTFFMLISVLIYIVTVQLFPGTFSWTLTFLAPALLYFGVGMNILVILFGITNWKNFRIIYCFVCRKSCKICSKDDETEGDADSS